MQNLSETQAEVIKALQEGYIIKAAYAEDTGFFGVKLVYAPYGLESAWIRLPRHTFKALLKKNAIEEIGDSGPSSSGLHIKKYKAKQPEAQ